METKDYVDLIAIIILITLALFWDFSHPVIKIPNLGVTSVFPSPPVYDRFNLQMGLVSQERRTILLK